MKFMFREQSGFLLFWFQKKKKEKKIHDRIYGSYFELGDPIFKVGDRVRITKYRSTYDNKLGNRWRTEIFRFKYSLY